MPAPPLVIRYLPIAQLVPYARNARTHSDAQIAEIGASILEFGWTNPVLVDEQAGIIAGHGRVLAAHWLRTHKADALAKKEIDLSLLPTIELAGLSEAQRAAYVIADNRLALNAGWNADMLAAEFMRLSELNVDQALTGFGATEIENLIVGFRPGGGDVDEQPWEGMPEFGTDPRAYRSIVVHLQDEAAVQDFARRMEQPLTDKTKSIYHPFKPKVDRQAQAWVEERGGAHDEHDGHDDAAPVPDLHPE